MAFSVLVFAGAIHAEIVIPMHLVAEKGVGKSIGTITVKNSSGGLLIIPDLHDLPPGAHGFHVHKFPSCENRGKAAGEHFDPQHTSHHLGPYSKKGHAGDLPVLIVNKQGNATTAEMAPRLTEAQIKGRALIIHKGGDNYSDKPKKAGGGGDRIACGVIKG